MRTTLCLLVFVSAFALNAQESPSEKKMYAVASRFVPPSMARDSAESPHERPLRTAVAKGKLDGSGKTYLVAAYANSYGGSVRVLVPRPRGAYRLGGEASRGMAGDFAHVRLKDVDGDGLNEILVSFAGPRGPYSEWILKWDGKRLVDLTPTVEDDGVITSAFASAIFEDLDGDGKLELIACDPYHYREPCDVYHLRKGAFLKTETLVFWKRYVGRFATHPDTFEVTNPDASYVITVVNGDQGGAHRVTDASVLVNGELIARAEDLAGRRSRRRFIFESRIRSRSRSRTPVRRCS